MTIIDFTRSSWGHASHWATFHFHQVEGSLWERFVDWVKGRCRYSIMVHCQRPIQPGDHISYRSSVGEVLAVVYRVEPCGDPDDMYTIWFYRDRSMRRKDPKPVAEWS